MLCKTMGYAGYRQFIVSITSELASNNLGEQSCYVDIHPGDSIESIIQNVSYTNQKSIDDTLGVLSKEAVKRAVILLRKARKIGFFGMGASLAPHLFANCLREQIGTSSECSKIYDATRFSVRVSPAIPSFSFRRSTEIGRAHV